MPTSLLISAGLSAATTAIVARVFWQVVISAVIGKLLSRSQRKPEDNGVRQQVPPSSSNIVPVGYGDFWMGGTFADAVLSIDQKTMYYVLPIASISQNGQFSFQWDGSSPASKFFYGDRSVQFDTTDQTRVTALVDGSGNADNKINGYMNVYLYTSNINGVITGANTSMTPNQVMGGNDILASLRWPATGRQMNGLAFAIVKLVYNQEAGSTGLQPLTFKCRHTLNNTGLAKPGDVFYDYLTDSHYGCNIPSSLVDSGACIALNNYSDETITYTPAGGGAAVTQPRYRINGVLDCGNKQLDNIDKILSACDSWLTYTAASGLWAPIINRDSANVKTFNDDNIVGDIRIADTDLNSVYNAVEAQFPSKQNYDKPDFVVQDIRNLNPTLLYSNEPYNKLTMQLELVNDNVQAQYLCNRLMEQSRDQLTVSFQTTYDGIQIDAGDVIGVYNTAYGWTDTGGKLFRVVKVSETITDEGLGASIEAVEYNAMVFDNYNITQFSPAGNTNLPSPAFWSALTAPVVTGQFPSDQIPSINLQFTMPTTGRVTNADLYYTTDSGANYVYVTSSNYPQGYNPGGIYPLKITGIPASNSLQFAWQVGNETAFKSPLSPLSTAIMWSPSIASSAAAVSLDFNPDVYAVPVGNTATSASGLALPISFQVLNGTQVITLNTTATTDGALANNTYRIGSAAGTTDDYTQNNLTVTGFTKSATGASFTLTTATGLTGAYLSVPIRYKDSSGSVQSLSQLFPVSLVQGGARGNDGVAGKNRGTAIVYQWSTATPDNPTGTSTFTYATNSNDYTGTDGWSATVPTNTGLISAKLYAASVGFEDLATATTRSINWTSPPSTITKQTINGNNVAIQFYPVKVYQTAASIPSGPTGTSQFSWATKTLDSPPTGWTVSPTPAAGLTVYAALVNVIDSTTATQTQINWVNAAVIAESYSGTTGASARVAYARIANNPSPTAGNVTVSGDNTPTGAQGSAVWGSAFNVTWASSDPTPTSNNSLYVIDGVYNGSSTIWSAPYIASLKVGQLSAISANLGTVTAGSYSTGIAGAKRVEINTGADNRVKFFGDTTTTTPYFSLGGNGTDPNNAVVDLTTPSSVNNPISVSFSGAGSGMVVTTNSSGNAYAAISSMADSGSGRGTGGRLFYGTSQALPLGYGVFQIDYSGSWSGNALTETPTFHARLGSTGGTGFKVEGSGNGYSFDASNHVGTGVSGTKAGYGYFKGIDLPSTASSGGSYAYLTLSFGFLGTSTISTSSMVLGGVTVSVPDISAFEDETGTLQSLTTGEVYSTFAQAVTTQAPNWSVSVINGSTSNLILRIQNAVLASSSASATVTKAGTAISVTFTDGSSPSAVGTVVSISAPPNDATKFLASNGQWLTAGGSMGGGTVTNVATGTGLTGGPITTTGTISLANTTVTAGTYSRANITVDAQGRLTAASNGASGIYVNVKDSPYNAKGDNSTDDTSAIQAAINAVAASTYGGTVFFPAGAYVLSSALTYSVATGSDPAKRVHFMGEGPQSSLLKQTGSNANGLTIGGNSANPNAYVQVEKLSFVASNGATGQGIAFNAVAFARVVGCFFSGWAYGTYGSNFLTSEFDSCQWRFNVRGGVFERISSTYSSHPNALTFTGCEFGANTMFGLSVNGAGVVNVIGGAIEGNGTTAGSSSNWGMRVSDPSGDSSGASAESSVGLAVHGVYFENNIGIADLYVDSSSAKSGVSNSVTGCSFNRISNSTYVTNNILLTAGSAANGFKMSVVGCGFKSIGYTASAARPTISNTNCTVDTIGCNFSDTVDAYRGTTDNVLESATRSSGFKNLDGTPYTTSSGGVTSLAAGTGITVSASTGAVTVTNSAPAASWAQGVQSGVALNAFSSGGLADAQLRATSNNGFSATGTSAINSVYIIDQNSNRVWTQYLPYAGSITGSGNITVTKTTGSTSTPDSYVISGGGGTGTVTSVAATAPLSISGTATTTPTVNITQASSSTNGYLSSTDWNTFNNKTSNTGTVTSVQLSGGTGITIGGTNPVTTSGTITVTNSAPAASWAQGAQSSASLNGFGGGLSQSQLGNTTNTPNANFAASGTAPSSNAVFIIDQNGNRVWTQYLPYAGNVTGGTGITVTKTTGSGATADSYAVALSIPSNTTSWLRGDGTWTNTLTGDIIAFSDAKLKKNFKKLGNPWGTFHGYKFNWKDTGRLSFGFKAQDIQKEFPELVHESEGKLAVNYNGIIALLWEQNQELKARVEALEKKL